MGQTYSSELSLVPDRDCINRAAHSSAVLFLPATFGRGRWGGERFAELDLSMGEATRLRDILDFLIKHEAAHALHKAKQQYNAAIDTQVNSAVFDCSTQSMEGLEFPSVSMTDELESQASSTPEQRKALRALITERAKEVRPDPKSLGAGKNPFANGNIRKWTNK